MFQKSIINSVKQDEAKVALRWASFQKFLEKVEYIKTVKEEKYQDGFLVDIFENCLGYTLDMTNPKSFNLEREKKNETDSKKADGVIYVDEKVVGVIELKAQDTKNLDKIETQAFNYHASHSNSKYIIISNFDELRFYVDKKTSYEKFNLFTLNYEEFKKLHLLISYESIKDDIPLKLKEKSNSFEQDISKKLYKDFSNFRTLLFENIVKNNLVNWILIPSVLNGEVENSLPNQQTLLRLTQKLCDRIIFILFAEDRDLLRSNMIKEIREEFINQKFTNYTLYDIYKFYFDAISNGNEKLDIPKYNGGLFTVDELLDSLIIDDYILNDNVQILSNYDFASEISVNILGHIFEQSLTDLEELQANIENIDFDKTKSKRKKDGVFYTPEYITRYIVENTLGKMCLEKREELKIVDISSPSNPKKLTKAEQQTKENLQEYKNWLLNLKILDPACGSGAFLNQALEYLINEHKNLQNDLALMGDLFASYMVEEEILEHNLYGVDINEDAVEIAKLSLWLRTAKRGRPLTKLVDKIKCGNSLIDDKNVVPNAFIWEDEFKEVFEQGGFDVVIGNPPYGAKIEKGKDKFSIKSSESAILFMQLAYKLLRGKGKHSFIIPKPFIYSSTWEKIREFFVDEINLIADCGKVWDSVKLEQIIYFLNKDISVKSYHSLLLKYDEFVNIKEISKNTYYEYGFFLNQTTNIDLNIASRIRLNTLTLLDISEESNRGGMFQNLLNQSGEIKVLAGINIQRYEIRGLKGFICKKDQISNNSYLRENSVLFQEIISHIQYPTDHIKLIGTIIRDIKDYVILDTIQQITLKSNYSNKFILGLLNSKLINWYIYRFIFAKAIRTMHFSNQVINRIPIPKIDLEEQLPIICLVDTIIECKELVEKYNKNLDILNSIEKIEINSEIKILKEKIISSENEIEDIIYSLYNISKNERNYIEQV